MLNIAFQFLTVKTLYSGMVAFGGSEENAGSLLIILYIVVQEK